MYEKYAESIRLMDAMLALEVMEGVGRADYLKRLHAGWDILFTHIHATFVPPTAQFMVDVPKEKLREEIELCRPFIDGTFRAPSRELEEMLRTIPPVIAEIVWPIAMARFLLRDSRRPINHRALSTFREFHNRYGALILGC